MARYSSTSSSKNTQLVIVLSVTAAAASVGLLVWYLKSKQKENQPGSSGETRETRKKNKLPDSNKLGSNRSVATEDSTKHSTRDEKAVHIKIEELDKKGKAFYKEKQFFEAAQAFTDALDLIENDTSESMQRQQITLLNNRSAMYEKAGVLELALHDCDAILEHETTHSKARPRKLRILESLKRYKDALREVCCLQLLFMQTNKVQIRMGLPLPPPPVPQSKMEDLLNHIVPEETARYVEQLNARNQSYRHLPGEYTVLQLLKSYTNYDEWTKDAEATTIDKLNDQLEMVHLDSDKAAILLKRGRRYVFERNYELATVDFETALQLAKEKTTDDYYVELLDWTGMVRHWHYNLDGALECLRLAAKLDPDNANHLVKQAGVQLDAGQQDEALKLFEQALILDPDNVDALLHRSNMRILQGRPEQAKSDLERCLRLRPNHTMARLRLAAVLVPMEDLDGAKQQLDACGEDSSEVQSYRGELVFAQGQVGQALACFEKALQLEPTNPTPYVNAAMALLNSAPAPGQMPDTTRACDLLEQAIRVDPQFAAAYVHLGQIRLGLATTLDTARTVVELYDQGLENCRTAEEVKELCGMRVLAVAQVEAAEMLKMDTFSLN